MAETELNPACCSRNIVITGEYTPKGTYTGIAGLDVCKYTGFPSSSFLSSQKCPPSRLSIQDFSPAYISTPSSNIFLLTSSDQTGDASSKRAILLVYDVFGLASQTLQGAPRLALSVNALVLIP